MPTYVKTYPNPDQKLYTALGISKKRATEMENTLEKILTGEDRSTTISDDIARIGEYCDDMNELAYMSYLYGCQIGKISINPLGAAIGDVLNRMMREHRNR